MKVRLKCEHPEAIEYTMTITTSAKEWEELRDQLDQKWPSSKLSNHITDLLSQARRIYWAKDDES